MSTTHYNLAVEAAWEDDLKRRYPETDYTPDGNDTVAFRNYDAPARDSVRAFLPYDLYTKCDAPPDVAALRPYYENLIGRSFPATLAW